MTVTKTMRADWQRALWAIAFLCLVSAASSISGVQAAMNITEMADRLRATEGTVLIGFTITQVMITACLFFSGPLAARIGGKNTLMIGLLAQVLPQFFYPYVTGVPMYFALRFIQGCNTLAFPLYITIITNLVPQKHQGKTLAFFNGSYSAGSGFGAYLSSFIKIHWGWQASFFAVASLALAVTLVLIRLLKPEHVQAKTLGGTGSARQESSMAIYRRILAMPVTWLLILGGVAFEWTVPVIVTNVPMYAQALRFSPYQISAVMTGVSFGGIGAALLMGSISDGLIGRMRTTLSARLATLCVSYALMALGAVALPLFASRHIALCTLFVGMLNFGCVGAGAGFWTLPAEIFDPRSMTHGTSITSGLMCIPSSFSALIIGNLGGRGHWVHGWMLCAGIAIMSICSLFLLPPMNRARQSD